MQFRLQFGHNSSLLTNQVITVQCTMYKACIVLCTMYLINDPGSSFICFIVQYTRCDLFLRKMCHHFYDSNKCKMQYVLHDAIVTKHGGDS